LKGEGIDGLVVLPPSPLRGGWRQPGGGREGGTALQGMLDGDPDTIEVVQDVAIGEAEDIVTGGTEKIVANSIICRGRITAVGIAVCLDNQPRVMAGEVGNILSYRHLPAKVKAEGFQRPQKLPQLALRRGRSGPQGSRPFDRHRTYAYAISRFRLAVMAAWSRGDWPITTRAVSRRSPAAQGRSK